MEPMISASTGGRSGSQPEATDPCATRTRSPGPLPSTSNATRRSPEPVTSTSRKAPLGRPSIRLVDQTLPTTIPCSITAPFRSERPAPAPCPWPAGSAPRAARGPAGRQPCRGAPTARSVTAPLSTRCAGWLATPAGWSASRNLSRPAIRSLPELGIVREPEHAQREVPQLVVGFDPDSPGVGPGPSPGPVSQGPSPGPVSPGRSSSVAGCGPGRRGKPGGHARRHPAGREHGRGGGAHPPRRRPGCPR